MSLDILDLFRSNQFILFIKIATLVTLALYIIFTFIIFTQVRIMNRILELTFASRILMLATLVNIILAISLFLAAFVIL